MTPAEARCTKSAVVLVGATGCVYAAMAYLLPPMDEFSIIGHPWQPSMLSAHVLTAPLLVFAFGLLFRSHALLKWRAGGRVRRRSGAVLLFCAPPMVLSGYLLPVVVAPQLRLACVITHCASSAVFLLAFVRHVWLRRHSAG